MQLVLRTYHLTCPGWVIVPPLVRNFWFQAQALIYMIKLHNILMDYCASLHN